MICLRRERFFPGLGKTRARASAAQAVDGNLPQAAFSHSASFLHPTLSKSRALGSSHLGRLEPRLWSCGYGYEGDDITRTLRVFRSHFNYLFSHNSYF